MKKVWDKIIAEAKSPTARPLEIWLFRIVTLYVATKLGIKVEHNV